MMDKRRPLGSPLLLLPFFIVAIVDGGKGCGSGGGCCICRTDDISRGCCKSIVWVGVVIVKVLLLLVSVLLVVVEVTQVFMITKVVVVVVVVVDVGMARYKD